MALAVSQSVKIESSSGTSFTGFGVFSLTGGALVVAAASGYQGTGTNFACSDSVNGAYTPLTPRDNGDPAIRLTYKGNITGGAAVDLTVDCGAGAGGVVGLWHEATGADVTPFDVENGGIGTGTAPDSAAATNSVANAIYFAAMACGGSVNPIAYTINAAGSEGTWITHSATESRELDGASFPACGVVYQIVSSAAARSHTWTITSSPWGAAVAVFKAAVSVTAVLTGTAIAGGVTEAQLVAGAETVILTVTGDTWIS